MKLIRVTLLLFVASGKFCYGRFGEVSWQDSPLPKPCVFPFTYDGVMYAQCTMVDSKIGVSWCATAAHFSDEEWRYCKGDEVKPACVLPFTFEGNEYTSCTTEGSSWGSPWCAITADLPQDGLWKYCDPAEELLSSDTPQV